MARLSATDQQKLKHMLEQLPHPVRLIFFTQTFGCETCVAAKQVLDEVVALSPNVTLEEINFVLEKEQVDRYGIDRVPAIAVVGQQDVGIRFYGTPAGYEFLSLIDAILLVSRGESGLSDESKALVAGIDKPVHLQVFVTPT